MVLNFIKWLYEKAKPHCREKFLTWRVLLTLLCLYALFRGIFDTEYQTIIGSLNTGIHELGHFIFKLTGSLSWHVAGGTIAQLGVPLYSLFLFYHQKDFFAIGFGLFWLATNLFYVAWYIGTVGDDSFSAIIPFGALGNVPKEVIHDWAYMLDAVGLENFYHEISVLVQIFAAIIMIAGIAWMIAMLKLIWENQQKNKEEIPRNFDI